MGYGFSTIGSPESFGCSVHAMAAYRDAMARLGMFTADKPCPTALFGEDRLAWHPEPVTGIAPHKFHLNEGWLVTPAEIQCALDFYRQHSAEEVNAILAQCDVDSGDWESWIGYLMHSSWAGGFEVG